MITVLAEDADIGNNSVVSYSLAGEKVEYFIIDPWTGVVTVSDIGVDFETLEPDSPYIILSVIATDLGTE